MEIAGGLKFIVDNLVLEKHRFFLSLHPNLPDSKLFYPNHF